MQLFCLRVSVLGWPILMQISPTSQVGLRSTGFPSLSWTGGGPDPASLSLIFTHSTIVGPLLMTSANDILTQSFMASAGALANPAR
jgi:hypothetical protein